MFGLWHRSKFDAELAAELELHLAELTAANRAAGMSQEEARQKALLSLGNPQRVKESCREALWTAPLEDALRDAAYALRSLRKARGLNLMTVLALALGIGCSTIIFSVVYNGVLHPFAYRAAERLVALRIDDQREASHGFRYEFRLDEIAAFRQEERSFEDVVGYGNWYATYAHDGTAETLQGSALTSNGMEFFGMQPLLGRGLTESDARQGAAEAVLLNYRFWKKQFLGDPGVLGKPMILDGRPRTIIGVMPARFQVAGANFWMPVSWNAQHVPEENEPRFLWATAILKRGVKLEAATADLNVVARQLARVHPGEYPKQFSMKATSLSEAVVADFKRTLLLLAAAVALLLLLSCSNAACLLLVRASARVKEMAMRSALGASRGRLVRQSLVETLVLAAAGCAVGCTLAFLGLKVVAAALLAPFTQIPWEASIRLNWPALLFAVGISLGSALLTGLAPAMYAGRGVVQAQLGGTGVGVSASFLGTGFRSALVIGQVGLSVVLFISAGLTVRSFVALTHADLGFRTGNVLEGSIHFPRGKYENAEEKSKYIDQLLAKLAALPGVTNVAEAIGPSLDGGPVSDVSIPGKTQTESRAAMIEACSEGYFRTLGLRLLHGRLLSTDDVATGRLVAVINQTLAKQYFSQADPLGWEIRFKRLDGIMPAGRKASFEIVGVVSDFRNQGLARPTMPEAFVPHSFTAFGDRGILVRTAIKPTALQESVRRTVWKMDPAVVLREMSTLENHMEERVYAKPRLSLISLSVCALLGLVLAVIGISSVMAYSVSLLTHEIGVRTALGARQSTVLLMVLKKGMKLVGTGMLLGFGAVFVFAPMVHERPLGISSLDLLTLVACGAVLLAAGLLACYFPALRATRVDTSTALRCE